MDRYRLRPDPKRDTDLYVAKYEPGQPLDDLLAVARKADDRAEVAEAPLPSGAVLLVKWTRYPDDETPETEWALIEGGGYLAYGALDGNLYDTDEADLHLYDRVVDQ